MPVLAILGLVVPLPGGAALAAGSPREEAVLQARAGNLEAALASLRRQVAEGTSDRLVAMDLATLLQENGRDAEAVAVFAHAADPAPPSYALLAATRANRNLRRYGEAARLARAGVAAFPDEPVWPVLLSLILSDSNQTKAALAALRMPAAAGAPPLEIRLAEGYAHRRAGDRWAALRAYGQALLIVPDNREAKAEVAGILQGLRGPFGASALAGTNRTLAADEAAAKVRWGAEIRPPEPARRFEGTDAALARLDTLISAQRAAARPDAGLLRRLRLDRLVALRDRVRMAEVVAEAEALRRDGPLPAYARLALGDALLHLKRPDEAAVEYTAVLEADPRDLKGRYGLFFASVEREDFAKAYAVADEIVGTMPVWQYYVNSPQRYPNTDYTYAAVTAGQARLWGNQVAAGFDTVAGIAAAAPPNAHARGALASAMSARGWPRAADAEAQVAASLAPDDVDRKIGLAEMALARHRLAEADERVAALVALYPENVSIQRLKRELEAQRGTLIEIEAKPANTRGGGVWSSGRELESTIRVSSPVIGDAWRVFALGGVAFANPQEGRAQRNLVGGGVAIQLPDLAATAYGTQSFGTLSRGGGGATLDWEPTDQIKFGVAGQVFSTDTPLRALLYGITANQVSASAMYRWDETRQIRAVAAYLPFSDGNRRQATGVDFAQRLISVPHFDLTGRVEVYGSRNSLVGAPYYNPKADFSAGGGLTAQHMIWRRYDTSITQVLKADAGLYAERGYKANWTAAATYEHRWRFDPRTEFAYGVSVFRRVYDGSPETGVAVQLALRQRL
ncbi:MAG: poly-beta-1,6 N-acetyl-D-glucosamine export porin PgaA [Alsobacter sp.]